MEIMPQVQAEKKTLILFLKKLNKAMRKYLSMAT